MATLLLVAALGLSSIVTPAGVASEPPSFLDCEKDAGWSNFRESLLENAKLGYPRDPEIAVKAQELLQAHWPDLEADQQAAYGASLAMRSFFGSCNAVPGVEHAERPFCLYGAISALWIIARHDHPDRHTLLRHAQFLLGSTMRNSLDFLESSGWPITSLDVLANLQAIEKGEDFRLPPDVDLHYRMPPGGTASAALGAVQVPDSFKHAVVRIVVWELGVHASLSAEPLQMWARLLSHAELHHRNLIQDQYPTWLPNRCDTLYAHPRLSCDEEQDDITELFRRWIPHSATSKDPILDIDGLGTEFAQIAGVRLNNVDIFLCTVAYLCLVVDALDLPTLGYFGHPLLFMLPDENGVREGFWDRFTKMAKLNSVEFAVSDPFLQMQYEYQVGSPRLPVIRTHALYTGVTHFPTRAEEVLVLDRPHEAVLMCLIRRLMPEGDAPSNDWPLAEGRLRAASSPGFPYRFVTRAMTDKQFSTFAQFRSVVLWAYDMDLLTFYEFYSMNMPIFMPAHLSKYIFQQDHIAYNYRWSRRKEEKDLPALWTSETQTPFEEASVDAAKLIVSFSDYFRFPEVQYFESIPDLLHKLPRTNFFEVVQSMARFNHDAMVETSHSWRTLLRRATGFETDFF